MGKLLILLYSILIIIVPYLANILEGKYIHYLPFFLCGLAGVVMLGLGDCMKDFSFNASEIDAIRKYKIAYDNAEKCPGILLSCASDPEPARLMIELNKAENELFQIITLQEGRSLK